MSALKIYISCGLRNLVGCNAFRAAVMHPEAVVHHFKVQKGKQNRLSTRC